MIKVVAFFGSGEVEHTYKTLNDALSRTWALEMGMHYVGLDLYQNDVLTHSDRRINSSGEFVRYGGELIHPNLPSLSELVTEFDSQRNHKSGA